MVTVDLSNVTDGQTVTVTLTSVNDGVRFGDVTVPVSFLLGDTTANGTVNSTDVSQAKMQSGQAVGGSNFREDVNANGFINATDVSLVKLRSGMSLP